MLVHISKGMYESTGNLKRIIMCSVRMRENHTWLSSLSGGTAFYTRKRLIFSLTFSLCTYKCVFEKYVIFGGNRLWHYSISYPLGLVFGKVGLDHDRNIILKSFSMWPQV